MKAVHLNRAALVFILTSISLLILPLAPAYAVAQRIQGPFENDCNACSSRAVAFGVDVVKYDALVVLGSVFGTNGSILNAPTDALGNSFGSGSCISQSGTFTEACTWVANTTSSGPDSVTLTANINSHFGLNIFEVKGVYVNNVCQATGVSATGTPLTSTSCSWTGTAFNAAIAVAGDGQGLVLNTNWNGGAGACLLGGSASWKCVWAVSSSNPGVTSPTVFDYGTLGATSGHWVEAGISLPDVPFSETIVIPCTAFQLQCWLYPMFFVSTYVILICSIAVKGGVNQEDLKNLALESLTIGAMLGVIVGLFNVMIPLMLVIIQAVRAIRA